MKCRCCGSETCRSVIDLGFAPPSNAYVSLEGLKKPEITYPLRVYFCENCCLVQTEDFVQADTVFQSDYAYFSSTSASWLKHAKSYADMIVQRQGIGSDSFVIELASNDGYLLRNFVQKGIPCLGVEPTESTAQASRALGIETRCEFFGKKLAAELTESGKQADLIIGNNVFAHVPDIVDFASGIATCLKPDGIVTLEFPYLGYMIEDLQFDTIYHEHFSYLSLAAVENVFERADLRVHDVELLSTHGGSLRIFGCRTEAEYRTSDAVVKLRESEALKKLQTYEFYESFADQCYEIKNDAVSFLLQEKRAGRRVAAYGAAAKGNTFLNFAGIRTDLIDVVYDNAEAKQNMFLPGSHIPISSPADLEENTPDTLVILPWNIASEIAKSVEHLRKTGMRIYRLFPKVEEL